MESLATENLGTSKKSRWTVQVWKILKLVFWQEAFREGYRDDSLTLGSRQPGEGRGCAQTERYTGRQTDNPTPYSMIRVEVRAEKREANKHPPADLFWRWLLQAGGLSAQWGCPVLFAVERPRWMRQGGVHACLFPCKLLRTGSFSPTPVGPMLAAYPFCHLLYLKLLYFLIPSQHSVTWTLVADVRRGCAGQVPQERQCTLVFGVPMVAACYASGECLSFLFAEI